MGSFGLVDDLTSSANIHQLNNGHISRDLWVAVSLTDGTNGMTAMVRSLDSDGFTLTWTKVNSGVDAYCLAMGLR
jgi:hypothetical protein